ncbi:MAG: hypothetical protein AB7N76_08085 [Planctomycetota bacterium]
MAPPPELERKSELADAMLASRGARSFEIRSRSADSGADEPDEMPITNVVLPQSITQEEEEEDLKRAFGVDSLPSIDRQHGRVKLAQSQGATGPDRRRAGLKLLLVLALIALAAGAFYAWKQGLIKV